MTTPTQTDSFTTDLHNHIQYREAGVFSKVLHKDICCQYTLFCLATGTDLTEHASTRNATIHVIEGRGTLTLKGQSITLTPGVLVFMPANAPHALRAAENLAFLLTLSESPQHTP
ncbi:MAG: cupin domain-containing protein [Leptolyngbyaceae cyanobacterium SL_5_14]|nr:cupin domain-containing protein [Leptolyngbyaceae cyanobacterium SL_5_14]